MEFLLKVTALVDLDAGWPAQPHTWTWKIQAAAAPASSLPVSKEVTLFQPPQLLNVCKDHSGDI